MCSVHPCHQLSRNSPPHVSLPCLLKSMRLAAMMPSRAPPRLSRLALRKLYSRSTSLDEGEGEGGYSCKPTGMGGSREVYKSVEQRQQEVLLAAQSRREISCSSKEKLTC